MVAGSLAPIAAMVSALPLPFVAELVLGSGKYSQWALFATINTAGNTVDFGGMAYVAASYGSQQARSALVKGILATSVGSVAVGIVAIAAVFGLFHSNKGYLSPSHLVPGLALMTLATALNSTVSICSMSQLAIGKMKMRNQFLVGQAVGQLVITVFILVVFRSPYAIVFGVLISSFVVCFWGVFRRKELTPASILGYESLPLGRYVGAGSISLPTSSFVTQGDRWFVGATSTSRVLALYDLSARIVAVPKFICQSLNQSIVSDAASVKSERARLRALIVQAKRLTDKVAFSAIPFGGICAYLLLRRSGINDVSALTIAFFLSVGAGVHASTSPLSSLVNGIGRPWLEARYLVITAGLAVVGWSFALAYHSAVLAGSISGLALLIGSTFFIVTTRNLYSSEGQEKALL